MEQAPFSKRLIALFADWTLSFFVATFLAAFNLGSVASLQYLVFFIEVVLFTTTVQASVGQKLMKLKIVSFPDGGYLPFPKVLLRTLLLVLVIPALFTTEGRGFHDVLAKSSIINA